MNKLVWIGVAAVVAVVLLFMWMYSTLLVGHTPPPDRFKQDTATSQTPQSHPAATVAKPPFDASAYEVNYTLVYTISLRGATVAVEGWVVVGTGPAGNYSFGVVTSMLKDTVVFKSATEGNAAYTRTCLHGYCTVNKEKWPSAGLIQGVNVTRTAKGQCRRLSYTGTLYEERGIFKRSSHQSVGNLTGNYTAYVCEVNGVMLSADLTATASAYGEPVRITLKIEAVKAGPYSPETYRRVLQEVKANK